MNLSECYSLAVGVCQNSDFHIFLYELIVEIVENMHGKIVIMDFSHIFNYNKLVSIANRIGVNVSYIKEQIIHYYSPKTFEHLEAIFNNLNRQLDHQDNISLLFLMPSIFFKKQHIGSKQYRRNISDFYLAIPMLADLEKEIRVYLFDYIIEGTYRPICFTPKEFSENFDCLIEFLPNSILRLNKKVEIRY